MSSQSEKTKSLGILPFRFHQEKATNDKSFGEGLADALAMRLYGIEGLEVRPASSVRKFLSKSDDSFAIGKLLQVDYILEGYIFPAKQRTRFTVQLLKIPDRSVLWAAQFDEKEGDVSKIEDRVAERIAKAILPYLKSSPEEPITDSIPVQNTDELDAQDVLPEPEEEEIPVEQKVQKVSGFRYPLIVLLILAVLLGGYFLWNYPRTENKLYLNASAPTILVMPFQNVGVRPEDNSVGTGIAETLTGSLGNTKKLFVLSANAGRGAARIGAPVQQIGREFNVDYLLRGNIQRAGENNDLQAAAELIETKTGSTLWTGNFRASEENTGSLQAQIVEAVLRTLSINLSSAEKQKIAKRETNNGLAYEFYLVGRYHLASRSHDGIHRAIGAFTQSLEKDSNFALAYVGLADAYSLESLYEIPVPADSYEKAKSNVLQALKLDEGLAEAHASYGYILSNNEHNRVAAEREFQRAIELNPSYATTHHWYAITLSMMGRHDEALTQIEFAQKLDPQSAIISSAKGMIQFYARNYREAIAECEKALTLDPGLVPAHKVMRWVNTATNNYSAAQAAFQKEKNFSGVSDSTSGWLILEAQVAGIGDNKQKAQAILEKGLADKFVQDNPVSYAYETALAYAILNNKEKTLEWLEKAVSVNDHGINFLTVEPRWDNIRDDERFKALVKKVSSNN